MKIMLKIIDDGDDGDDDDDDYNFFLKKKPKETKKKFGWWETKKDFGQNIYQCLLQILLSRLVKLNQQGLIF